jgi:outer membrane lipase/esterase
MNNASLFARLKRALTPALAVATLLGFSFLPSANAAAGGIPAQPDHNPPFPAIHVLGDSLSDTGRTAGVIPGVFAFLYPSPPYAAGRLSNGPVWIEYLAPQLRLPYNPLDNFSWAGATTGTTNVYGSLPGMLNELGELIGSPPQQLDKKALYVVFGGANDFSLILLGADPNVIIPAGVTNLITIVSALRVAGAEHIVVVDLPDIGRSPRALSGPPGTSAGATQLSIAFNSLLNSGLDALPFPVVRVSSFSMINDMVARPHKYGFSNVVSPGVLDLPNSDTHLFWDDLHPTTRAHRFIADEIFHALARAGMLAHQTN